MKRIRARLTFANVVACIALFVALGGVSYAALKLPKNSVGSKQLKRGAVTSAKVKDHSLKLRDFKAGQLPQGTSSAPAALPPSAFNRDTTVKALPLNGFLALNQATITTTVQSRVIAQASIDLNATIGSNVYCWLTDGSTFSDTKADWSHRANVDTNGNAVIGLVGAKVLPPGTFTVKISCARGTEGAASYLESDLALFATAG